MRRTGTPRAWPTWVAILLVGATLLLLIPRWEPLILRGTGLDASWIAALDYFAFSDLQFGRDVVYTYGPLGFLNPRFFTPRTHHLALLWGVFCALALTAGFAALARRLGWWSLPAAAAFCLVMVHGPGQDSPLFMVATLLLLVTAGKWGQRLTAAEVLLALALAAGALMKIVHLVSAVFVLAMVTLANGVEHRRANLLPAVFGGAVLALWVATGQRLVGWGDYLRNGWELTSGYAETMAWPGPPGEVALILGCLAVVAASWRWQLAGRWRARSLFLGLAALGLFFLAFKLGFVRHQYPRSSTAWQVLVGAAVLPFLLVRGSPTSRRQRAAGLIVVAVTAGGLGTCQWWHARAIRGPIAQAWQDLASAAGAIRSQIVDPRYPQRIAERQRQEIVDANPLPPIEGAVDLFGDDQAILIAHGLDYVPRPVFQSYVTFTDRLVRLNGEHYRGEEAPPRIVARLQGFQGTPAGYLDSEALFQILQRYRVEPSPGELLVLRRSRRRPLCRTPFVEREVRLGTWISLPKGAAGVWANVEAENTLPGALMGRLYKLPPLEMTARFERGREQTREFSARQGAGFLLSPVIFNNENLQYLIRQGLHAAPRWLRIASFRISEADGRRHSWSRRALRVRLATIGPCPEGG